MSIKTVRFDKNTEQILAYIIKQTHLSISDSIKQGLALLKQSLQQQQSAFDVYSQLDLGAGDDKIASSLNVKQAMSAGLQRKYNK
ncbi:MAG: hypothetical protein KAT71_04165 [Gammaproteobacteria bacterium]|nr:hypothetical protein [Gammaproteobacteria bacterium]